MQNEKFKRNQKIWIISILHMRRTLISNFVRNELDLFSSRLKENHIIYNQVTSLILTITSVRNILLGFISEIIVTVLQIKENIEDMS